MTRVRLTKSIALTLGKASMDWDDLRRSENVEDERGSRSGLARGAIPLGLGGLVVVVVGSLLFGLNPLQVLSMLTGGGEGHPRTLRPAPRPMTAPRILCVQYWATQRIPGRRFFS
jgi:hypothetical protein